MRTDLILYKSRIEMVTGLFKLVQLLKQNIDKSLYSNRLN